MGLIQFPHLAHSTDTHTHTVTHGPSTGHAELYLSVRPSSSQPRKRYVVHDNGSGGKAMLSAATGG